MYKNIHGVDLEIDGDMVVFSDIQKGEFEKHTFKFLSNLIDAISWSDNDPLVFADIGAYTGLYSIYAAKRGCTVEAFEPNPEVYKRFKANIDHNYNNGGGWSGIIRHHNCGLSDSAREAYLKHNRNVKLTSGGTIEHFIVKEQNNRKSDNLIKVSIDTYGNQYQRPDIVKIDVEGHELSVLRGMECLNDNGCKPFIIVEANYYEDYCVIMEYLTEKDYTFVDMLDERNMVFKPKEYYNLLMNSIIA